MSRFTRRSVLVLVVVLAVAVVGSTPVAAGGDKCSTDCLDPGTGGPDVATGQPFDGSPIDDDVDPVAVMPGDNTTFGDNPLFSDEFSAFLKAKKAF